VEHGDETELMQNNSVHRFTGNHFFTRKANSNPAIHSYPVYTYTSIVAVMQYVRGCSHANR
jgi:hypothetical protein